MYQFGEVKDINDPEKLGRVKVSVYGFHDDIPVKELGWSNVVMPANTPATLGQGHSVNLREEVLWKTGDLLPNPITSPAPEFKVITDVAPDYTFDVGSSVPKTGDIRVQGSLVCGMFLDPAQQEFLVVGSLPTKTAGVKDNNLRVRGDNDPHANEEKGVYEPVSPYDPTYPYNHVYETESGHVKEYDDTPGIERIKERHKSGTQYEIGPNGSKVERIVNDNYQLVAGNDTIEVKGSVKIIVSGDCKLSVAKDLTANVGGNIEANVTGNALATIGGTTTVLNTGDMDLTVSGKDSANITIKSQYSVAEAAGSTTIHKGEIKLDGNVTVTGTSKLIGETRIADDTITLDTHTHGSNNVNQANTAGPNTN